LFMESRRSHFDELGQNGAVAPEILFTEGLLSVEGVALVRLAERSGINVEDDYVQVPSIACERYRGPYSQDSWTTIEA
jgi:hypothetical protein